VRQGRLFEGRALGDEPDDDAMRCLTLTPPWSGLMAAGIKLVENRTRPMIKKSAIGTRFALHASSESDDRIYNRIIEIAPDLDCDVTAGRLALAGVAGAVMPEWYRLSRITGQIIAVATLEAIIELPRGVEPGSDEARARVPEPQRRWFFQEIGYLISDVVVLPAPIRCRGFQSYFRLSPELERQVLDQALAGALAMGRG
jgi:hypothetical protein